MPIYEYECTSCGARFEELRKISERNKSLRCRGCGSNAMPIFSSPSLMSGVNSRLSKTASGVNNRLGKTAILLEPTARNCQITNCTFENFDTGISLPEDSDVKIKGNKFKNVKTPVEFRKK